MEKIRKICWEQTPAISCHYRFQTTIQKNAKDRSALATMAKDGSITLPLVVVAGAALLLTVTCICCCCRHKDKKKALHKEQAAS